MTNRDTQTSIPLWKLGLVGSYCGTGIMGGGFLVYKLLTSKSQITAESSVKIKLIRQPVVRSTLLIVGYLGTFLTGLGATIYYTDCAHHFLKHSLKKETAYSPAVKVDPVLQNYYLIDALQYFQIKPTLVDKVQAELVAIKTQLQAQGQSLSDEDLSFEKQLIKIMVRRNQVSPVSNPTK